MDNEWKFNFYVIHVRYLPPIPYSKTHAIFKNLFTDREDGDQNNHIMQISNLECREVFNKTNHSLE